MAGLSHGLHGSADYLSRQHFPDLSDGDFLERQADVWGIVRRAATFATGTVTFTGTDATSIPAGTLVQREDGAQYATDAIGTIASGTADVAATAVEAGVDGNADASTTVSLSSPIAGIDSAATIAAGGMTGGANDESDDDLRARLLLEIQGSSNNASESAYVLRALEVAGVTRAFALSQYLGVGNVGVTFLVDDDPSGPIPSAGQVATVDAHLQDPDFKPPTANVITFAPAEQTLDPDITITPDNGDVRGAVEASLEDMLRRDAAPGGTILLSRIREAISVAAGETDHVLNSPVADVTTAAGEIVTLGTVTWTP